MKLAELHEDEDDTRTVPNPIKSIGADDPDFASWYDRVDDLIDRHIPAGLRGPELGAAIRNFWQTQGKVTAVPLDRIIGSEPMLEPTTMQRGSSNLPYIALIDGNYFVIDGNHRVARAHHAHSDTIRALVIAVPSEIHERESRRSQVRYLMLNRNRNAKNAKGTEIPQPDGGSSKNVGGQATGPNVQTVFSDMVPM